VSQAGDWLFVLAFGAVVSLIFTALVLAPAAWTLIVQWNSAEFASETIRQSCGASAAVTLLSTAIFLWRQDVPVALTVIAPTLLGGLAGGFVITRYKPPYRNVIAVCLGFSASSLLILLWFSSLFTLLSPFFMPCDEIWSTIIALGLVCVLGILLAAYIIKRAAGIFLGLLIAGFWIIEQVSPEGGTMVASALYSANLGGGRPAHVDQSKVTQGEVCNLGVDMRPVLVLEADGCERVAALKRLRSLRGLGSLERKRVLMGWRLKAEEQLRNRHNAE
jgi:hypothetical protein